MLSWIRFWITAACLLIGLLGFAAAVLGLFRFGFVMNRMHTGGIGDTFSMFFIILGLAVTEGISLDMLKLFILVVFMWFTCPVASHFLGQVEYYTNPDLYTKVSRWEESWVDASASGTVKLRETTAEENVLVEEETPEESGEE